MNLIGQLNTLESTGLVRLISAQPELEYLFRHALVQDAAYGSLLKRDRRQLHLAVGEALEQLYPDQRAEQAATLAYHFEKAEVRDRAVHYLTLAGERARNGYANAEAIAFYQAAINQVEQILSKITEQPEDWRGKLAGLFESLADVLELTGQHEAAGNAYDQALTALARLAHSDQIIIECARIRRKLGFAFTVNRQHAEAQRAFEEGEKVLGPHPPEQDASDQANAWRREWIEIQVERAWNHYWRFQTDEMEAVCEKVRPILDRWGTPVQRAREIAVISLARLQRDRYLPSDETLALGRESLAIALTAGDFNLILDARFALGFMHLWRREFDQAEGPLRASMEMAERTGDAIRKSRCVTYLMLLARMRGQVEATRAYITQSLELSWAGQMTNYTYTAQACLAWVAWREGDLVEARAQAQTALGLLQGPFINYPTRWPVLWPLLAVAFTEQQLAEAVDCARALINPIVTRLPDPLVARLEAAIAASEQNQMEDAHAQLQRAINLAQEMGYL